MYYILNHVKVSLERGCELKDYDIPECDDIDQVSLERGCELKVLYGRFKEIRSWVSLERGCELKETS